MTVLPIPVTRGGLLMPRTVWLFVMFLASFVLVMSALPNTAVADEPKKAQKSASAEKILERPDRVSAMSTAMAQDQRVEVVAERTATDQVFANPDGTWSVEGYAEPVRVEDAHGSWSDIDLDLKQTDKGWEPKSTPTPVVFSDGGDNTFAEISDVGGKDLGWGWPTPLPEPVVKDNTLTYPNVVENGDLVVTALATGFTHSIVLREAPDPEAPLQIPIPLDLDGARMAETSKGSLDVMSGRTKLATAAAPLMWDAADNAAGDPENAAPVDASVEKDGANTELVLTPDADMLADPATVYPVTIDPTFTVMSSGSAWVESANLTTGQTTSQEMRVGTYDSGTTRARSFVRFGSGAWAGKNVVSANMRLYNHYSTLCGNATVTAKRITEAWNGLTLTWANQPAVTNTGLASTYGPAHGGPTACTDGDYVNFNVTTIAAAWASGTTNNGIRLWADGEATSNLSWRKFRTAYYTGAERAIPRIDVTYNSVPHTPSAPTVAASRTWDSSLFVSSDKPTWSASATDPDGGTVKYTTEAHSSTTTTASTLKATCTTGLVASGAVATCASTSALVNGTTYWARTKATDSAGLAGPWSAWRQFTVDTTTPPVPAIGCSDYADGQWYDTAPAANTTCTFTAGAGADVDWKVNNAGKTALTLSGGSATAPSVAVPTTGYTQVEARSRTRSGAVSEWKSFAFGTGSAALTEPVLDDRSTSTFPVNAAAPPGAESAKIQWRVAASTEGDTTTDWTDATDVKVASSGDAWSGTVSGTDSSVTPRLLWTPASETGIASPAVVEMRVVFHYPGSVDKASPLQRIQVVPHAFGGSFPTEDAGPGQVALFTGEFQVSETDIEVPGYSGSLSLSRSHLSMAGEPAGPAGVFGPGWVADLSGPDAGTSGFSIVDHREKDGSIMLQDAGGESYVYVHEDNTKGVDQTGTYVGLGETALEDDTLKVTNVTDTPGIDQRLTLTESDGTKTVYERTTSGVWTTAQVIEPESNGTTTYAHDGDGDVTWIFADTPSGVACDKDAQEAGCRALNLVYTGTGAAKRLAEVKLRIWDPKPGTDGKPGAGSGMNTISVQKYAYDSSGRLGSTWDPRLGDDDATAQKTLYEYDTIAGKTVLTKITDPGLKPWNIHYDTSGTDQGKVTSTSRAQDSAVGGADATWTIKYDRHLASTGDGLPDLSSDATATWGQPAADAPTGATAVFGPDQVPDAAPTAANYEYADLSYYSRTGRTTNTASFGAGAWQIDSTRYDANGNTIWALDAAGRNKALDEGAGDAGRSAGAGDKYASLSVYNDTGTRVEEAYSPTHEVVLDNGDQIAGRSLTQTVYDDEADSSLVPGRPTMGADDVPLDLAVEERSSVTDKPSPGAAGDLFDTKKTRYRYDPVSDGDGDGWALKTPTRTLTEDGPGWATTLTRFDGEGKTVETRTPQGTETTDGPGSDSRSTKTLYYSAGANDADAACGLKPEWAGLVCWIGPAGQPGTGDPIPATRTTGYSVLLAPTRVEESSGGATRVDVTTLDAGGRELKSLTTTSGLATADRPIAETTNTYRPDTGALATVTNGTQTQTTAYDSWGRTLSQTDGAGNTATTTYDTAGRVATSNDGKGTSTFTYNGDDSLGNKERRGLATKVNVGLASGPSEFTGAYDDSGALVEQNYPGGIKATYTHDLTGAETGLSYTQTVGGVESDLLGFSQQVDNDGRVRNAAGPDSEQAFTYDDRDRLSTVEDTTGDQCTTRTYGFSGDSDRTSLKTYAPDSAGACQSTTGSTANSAFDAADRLTGTGYTYDKLGRTLTVPASDTSNPDGGTLTAGYHVNDMVATLSQTVVENGASVAKAQDFSLDVAGRLSVTKNLTTGVSLKESTNHYDGGDDAPAWTETKTRPDAATAWTTPTWNRYVSGLGGMAVIQGSDGTAKIQLPNLHDDIVATADIAGTGINSYSEYTEYGQARDPANAPDRYGWLGTKQRDADTIGGLTLMGARLYNPTCGRFLSRDPVAGGDDNTYTYPTDPINKFDLNGQWWSRSKWGSVGHGAWRYTRRGLRNPYVRGFATGLGISAACAFTAGAACAFAAGAAIGGGLGWANYRFNHKKRSRSGYARAIGYGAASGLFRGALGHARALHGGRMMANSYRYRHRAYRAKSYVGWGRYGRNLWRFRH